MFGGDGSDTFRADSRNYYLLAPHQRPAPGTMGAIVHAGLGNDIAHGSMVNDRFSGNDQADLLFGYAGNDILNGGAGNDLLEGGDNANTDIAGRQTYDVLDGGSGHDLLLGGNQNDLISGGTGEDQLYGDAVLGHVKWQGVGDDYGFIRVYDPDNPQISAYLFEADSTEAGDDILQGNQGNDHLDGGADYDNLFGGEGDDIYYASAGNTVDLIEDNQGIHTLVFNGFSTRLGLDCYSGQSRLF